MGDCCGGPGEACCGGADVASTCDSAPLTVTLVTGPGCGWGGSLLCDPGSEVGFDAPEGSTWDMPSAWRVHAVEERLRREGLSASVTERDLYSLVDAERHAVLDAMIVRQAEPPMVVVNGVVACFGDIDLDEIVRVARKVTDGGGCGC